MTNTEDDTSPVKDLVEQAQLAVSLIDQLIEDMEDDEFYTLPPGEWEAKNGRDENGFPIK